MIAALRLWFSGLTPRERGLVGLALALALGLGLAEGVALPLHGLWQAERATHLARRGQVQRLERRIAALARAEKPKASLGLGQLVADAARRGVVLEFDPSQAALLRGHGGTGAVLAWLEGLPGKGWVVRRLALAPGGQGTVQIEAKLAPEGAAPAGAGAVRAVRPESG